MWPVACAALALTCGARSAKNSNQHQLPRCEARNGALDNLGILAKQSRQPKRPKQQLAGCGVERDHSNLTHDRKTVSTR